MKVSVLTLRVANPTNQIVFNEYSTGNETFAIRPLQSTNTVS